MFRFMQFTLASVIIIYMLTFCEKKRLIILHKDTLQGICLHLNQSLSTIFFASENTCFTSHTRNNFHQPSRKRKAMKLTKSKINKLQMKFRFYCVFNNIGTSRHLTNKKLRTWVSEKYLHIFFNVSGHGHVPANEISNSDLLSISMNHNHRQFFPMFGIE